MNYIPHTDTERAEMLSAIGISSTEDLFRDVPAELRHPLLGLPEPLAEMDVLRLMRGFSERNRDVDHWPSFLGAGAYRHFVPSVVSHLARRAEFYTAYTPYQPEASQGTLQAMYEYQSLICELTGMEVANASMYDGASALAEAAAMAARTTGRHKVVVAGGVHPDYRAVLKTHTAGLELEVVEQDGVRLLKDGQPPLLSVAQAASLLDEDTAGLLIQHPNFFGYLEDIAALSELAHQRGALAVVCVDPIALGLLEPPSMADIVVGEGQSLGSPLAFGGPYLGFFACREQYVRRMPGRIAGATTDARGERGFVLTLQTREQHIRREKATSNICTNEALCALTAAIYLSVMGQRGLRQVATLCLQKAHYVATEIAAIPGYQLVGGAPFFKEFPVRAPMSAAALGARLLSEGIIGGYDLGRLHPAIANYMLFCVTEMNTRAEMDRLVAALRKISQEASS